MSEGTGVCGKCDSEISAKAERCPECGYEPSNQGALASLFSILAVLWLLVGLFLLVGVVLGAILGGFLFQGIIAATLFGAFTLIPAAYLYAVVQQSQHTPVNDEISVPFVSNDD